MSYLRGLGLDENAPKWCSDLTPRADCTASAGVCMPFDATTLAAFQKTQRLVNAILAKRGLPLIDVDGRIGPRTVSALKTISSTPESITSCDVVAAQIYSLLWALTDQAGREQAVLVPDPPTSRPSTVKPDGTIYNPPDAGFAPTTLAIVAIGIGAVLAVGKKGKKRR